MKYRVAQTNKMASGKLGPCHNKKTVHRIATTELETTLRRMILSENDGLRTPHLKH